MNWNPDLYVRTLNFAAKAHGNQEVPGGGHPCVVHLAMVCAEVLRTPGLDTDFALQCALLHDTLEDTSTTADEILHAFGTEVLVGVQALTKRADLAKEAAMQDSLLRILECPPEVAAVKLADRITNLQPPPSNWSGEKRRAYMEEARLIHQHLASRSQVLGERLASKIKTYADYLDAP
jgi:(p)ppGpp synthase/HD superfamily hydrolase